MQPSAPLRALHRLMTTFINGSRFGHSVTKDIHPYIPESKLVVIPPTVERLDELQPEGLLRDYRDKRNVVFAGQVARHKGPDLLIDAFATVAAEHEDAHLHVIGGCSDPAYESQMLVKIGRSPAKERIRFWGYREDARSALRDAYVYVQPSRPSVFHESFGRGVVEAMSVGVPAVVFRSGALQETVIHGATGRICEAENVDCLAQDLLALFDNPVLRDGYGEAALQRFEAHYSPEVVREHWIRLLQGTAEGET